MTSSLSIEGRPRLLRRQHHPVLTIGRVYRTHAYSLECMHVCVWVVFKTTPRTPPTHGPQTPTVGRFTSHTTCKHTSFDVLRLGTAPSRSRRSQPSLPVGSPCDYACDHAAPFLVTPPSPQSVAAVSLRSSCLSPNFRRAFPRQSSAAIPVLTSTALLAPLHSILACSFLLLTFCVQACSDAAIFEPRARHHISSRPRFFVWMS